MGTRSVTYVYDENEMIIALYRQYDGYPTGMGEDLHDFLHEMRIVNGLTPNADNSKTANGMGCLAAQMVAHFKTEPGGFYLYPPSSDLDAGQEYEYHIFLRRNELWIKVKGWQGDELYKGPVAECVMRELEE